MCISSFYGFNKNVLIYLHLSLVLLFFLLQKLIKVCCKNIFFINLLRCTTSCVVTIHSFLHEYVEFLWQKILNVASWSILLLFERINITIIIASFFSLMKGRAKVFSPKVMFVWQFILWFQQRSYYSSSFVTSFAVLFTGNM